MGPSVQQLLIILLIVVLLFGAKKIPELAKGLGKGIKSFKSEMESDDKKAENIEKVEEKKEDTITATKADETTKNA
ncbi:twin-arginine translocase TatA/TatE family subunit [Campylobacter sp. CCUG 57310]|uniref:Sec-independent protein translocase subunit TatA/TatB n=1 Tax=Campylobacter sp. CCUG 57310 TaxID=2517362 RepID=UPI001566910D|nr:twin-arginine translocase TatA/TatE family subunit [Campylobacter sp. CCUG 57310]QKF91637.1 twin arginine translocation system, TatA/E family protein [Campylobacter sp. CCUG 57310]